MSFICWQLIGLLVRMLAESWADYAKLCILPTTCLQGFETVREMAESSADLALPEPG